MTIGAVALDELEQLEKAATPGEWCADGIVVDALTPPPAGHRLQRLIICDLSKGPQDAALIAAARNMLPELIAEVRRLRAHNAKLEQRLAVRAHRHEKLVKRIGGQ